MSGATNVTANEPVPELGVLAAMLKRAIQDAVYEQSAREKAGGQICGTSARVEVVQEARAWIFSDSRAAWSAHWCCELLDMDIQTIRALIKERPAELRRNLKATKP